MNKGKEKHKKNYTWSKIHKRRFPLETLQFAQNTIFWFLKLKKYWIKIIASFPRGLKRQVSQSHTFWVADKYYGIVILRYYKPCNYMAWWCEYRIETTRLLCLVDPEDTCGRGQGWKLVEACPGGLGVRWDILFHVYFLFPLTMELIVLSIVFCKALLKFSEPRLYCCLFQCRTFSVYCILVWLSRRSKSKLNSY